MSVPLLVLLAFAGWTLAILFGCVGAYRWSRILTGRATIRQWRADEAQGDEWYRRAMRAHMNCVENLPVYAAIAVAAYALDVDSRALDGLALAFLAARVGQSLVHVALPQTERVAALRFGLFFAQALLMVSMGAVVVAAAVR